VPLNVGLQAKYSRLIKIGVAESISGDRFGTGSRINVLTAHTQNADIIVTDVAENGVARPK